MTGEFDIVILGLSVTSSWGNGHATTYRSLIRGLAGLGHSVLFLERNTEWYAGNRDEPHPEGARTCIYDSFDDLTTQYEREIAGAGLVIVGSFVPEGTRVGDWVLSVAKGVTAFYDIDTPVTMSALNSGSCAYLTPKQITRYHLYLSFTGGPVLRFIEGHYGSPMARALYCSVDPRQYQPVACSTRWDLGYLGTYSDDRQPVLDELLLKPARQWRDGRFAVVGPMYPEGLRWPLNVTREIHLSPREHPKFYGSQRFTLNVTRAAMKQAGYSPSVRLFEAGACGVPIISDWWHGLDALLAPGLEVLIASTADDTLRILREYSEEQRAAIGAAARGRILSEHTPAQRARELENYWKEAHDHLSPDTPWRQRRHRKPAGGVVAGVASQPPGETAGGDVGGAPGTSSNHGNLHQPAGARR